jgi:hypothetical protein
VENTVPLHSPQSKLRQVRHPSSDEEDHTCRLRIQPNLLSAPVIRMGPAPNRLIGNRNSLSLLFSRAACVVCYAGYTGN